MGLLKFVLLVSAVIGLGAYVFNEELKNYWYDETFQSFLGSYLQLFPEWLREKLAYQNSKPVGKTADDDPETIKNKNGPKACTFGDSSCERLLTPEELKKYDGSGDSLGLYLSILGHVIDVEKGAQYYRPGSGYGFFAGIDGTRAFVTGDFTETGLIDDVEGLDDDMLAGLNDWLLFYLEDYTYVGKLIGRYFDETGKPTEFYKNFKSKVEQTVMNREKDEEFKQQFPHCNSEYKQDKGGRVWCSKMSGGIARDWAGVPRQLFVQHQKVPRCACVRNSGPPTDSTKKEHSNRGDLDSPLVREYANCDPKSVSCPIS